MIVEHDGLKISCESDRFIREVLIDKEYEFSKTGKVVIDLGANIGTYSFYAYPDAEVIYAIEPSDEYKYLEETITLNSLDKIKPFNIALGGENGKKTLYLIGGTGSATFSNNTVGAKTKDVEVKTLATFIKENNIKYVDWLKCDIEGAEIDVFSAPDFHEVSSRIGLIFGETHGAGHTLTGLLEGAGFDVQHTGGHFIARHI